MPNAVCDLDAIYRLDCLAKDSGYRNGTEAMVAVVFRSTILVLSALSAGASHLLPPSMVFVALSSSFSCYSHCSLHSLACRAGCRERGPAGQATTTSATKRTRKSLEERARKSRTYDDSEHRALFPNSPI
jgi:hypothetical protein